MTCRGESRRSAPFRTPPRCRAVAFVAATAPADLQLLRILDSQHPNHAALFHTWNPAPDTRRLPDQRPPAGGPTTRGRRRWQSTAAIRSFPDWLPPALADTQGMSPDASQF